MKDFTFNFVYKSFLLYLFTVFVKGETFCEYETCWDDDYYCCNGYCCNGYTSVYEMWWFWFIWIVVFFFIISCTICIRRRRAARMRYVRIAQVPVASGYNTIVSNQYTHIQPPRYYEQPTAPMYPPQYQQTEAPKQPPPPYQ